MEEATSRIVQVFLWRQDSLPDLAYARRVLGAVNPEAYVVASGENPPLQLFSITGAWPDEPWERVLDDMLSVPAPYDTHWTDANLYRLEGWQGIDSRTGDRLFVVTVYEQRGTSTRERFVGTEVQPPFSRSQPPHYPQYPTPTRQPEPPYGYPQYPGVPPADIYGQPYAYPYGYSPMPIITGAFPAAPGSGEPPQPIVPQDYAHFYVGFGERLAAMLMDAFFVLLPVVAIGSLLWVGANANSPQPGDLGGWLGTYTPFICLGLLVFLAYHLIGWSLHGRTWGKALMGMRIVRADGTSPGFGHALLRILGYLISTLSLGWGFLLIAFDSHRQGLHDKIAETYVVPDEPVAAPPFGLPGYRTEQRGTATEAGVGYVLTPPRAPTPRHIPPPTEQHAATDRTSIAFERPAQPQARASTNEQPEANGDQIPTGEEQEVRPQEPAPIEPPEPFIPSAPPANLLSPVNDVLERERPEQASDAERARSLFREGIAQLERGVHKGRNRGLMDVDPSAARAAAERFRSALELVPSAIAYRYFYAVALRYSEGFEAALAEFRRVLELDPGHFEAKQQIAFGPRWHDAFAYPAWSDANNAAAGTPIPEEISELLVAPRQPGTRLILLRNGANKVVAALSRTPRDSWAKPPTPNMPARIELILSRTPSGPVVAFYLIVQDDPDNPFKGETFLNPHDPGLPSDDACQLGQHVLEQLAQQDHTYLIFVDENDRLLLSRKLVFGAAAQVNIARILYEVQGLPAQVMDPIRFQQAAQWHMEHFPLDQVK